MLVGKADLGIILTSNLGNPEALQTRPLIQAQRRLWSPNNSPLMSEKSVSLQQLNGLPYVFLMVDEGERVLRELVRPFGFEPNVVLRTTSMEAMREWIGLGLGVTIVADTVYRPWSLEGLKIERRAIADPIPPLEIGLVWRKDRPLDDLTEGFATFMRQSVPVSDGLD